MPRKTTESKIKAVKRIPGSENGHGIYCTTASGQAYIVSQCMEKMRFSLWHKVDGGYAKISTAKSPYDLYDKIPWGR